MTSPAAAATIWDRHRLGITVGSVVLILLGAIEALAVTTVMPLVAADLHGEALYAVAFAGTLATGVIGMVASGAWSDRAGPRAPLYTAVALFIAGLVIAGAATDMYALVLGRLIQGLGAGAQTVALYVVVARVYPPALHGRIFAAFAAAWVVPSMIGPFLAGAVAQYLHWRWTFLGVAALNVIAFLLVVVRLRDVDLRAHPDGGTAAEAASSGGRLGMRILLSVVVAIAAVAVGFASDAAPVIGWPIAIAATVAIALAIRPLFPAGALRAAPGLPSVVLLRGLLAGGFFAAEAYVPRMLMERFEFSPTVAGLALTAAALAWSGASAVQGRYGERLGSRRMVVISSTLLLVAFLGLIAVAVTRSAPWSVVVLWGIAGSGIGLLYPRLNVLTLAYSTPADEGFNSSALSIADSTGSAVTIAFAGLFFVSAPIAGSGFPAVFVVAAAAVVIGLVPGARIGDGPRGDAASPAVSGRPSPEQPRG